MTYYQEDPLLVTCGTAEDIRFKSIEDETNSALTNYFATLPGQNIRTSICLLVLLFQGYFLAPATGNYTFIPSGYDYGYIWAGQEAFGEWSSYNSLSAENEGPRKDGVLNVTKGDIIPMTFLWANEYGDGNCTFSIITPTNEEIYNFSGLFLQPVVADPWLPKPAALAGECPEPPEEPLQADIHSGSDTILFYEGYNEKKELSPDNPGNDNPAKFPPISTLSPQSNAGEAFNICYAQTYNEGYKTFGLHWRFDLYKWQCVSYHAEMLDPAWFNVTSNGVRYAYGYTLWRTRSIP